MNEPFDENNDYHQDRQIAALYREASGEQPPAHLDDAILAAARREAHTKPKSISPFSTRWTLPFSLAAVIVLSVSVVMLIPKEELSKEPAMKIVGSQTRLSDVANEAYQAKKIAKPKLKAEQPRTEAKSMPSSAPRKFQPQAKKAAPRQRSVKSPVPKIKPPAENQPDATSSELASSVSAANTAAGGGPTPPIPATTARKQNKPFKSEAKKQQQPVMEEAVTAAASEPSEAVAAAIGEQSRKTSGNAAGFMAAAPPQPSAAPEADTSRLITGHRSAPVTEPSCALLGARDCLLSPLCTYVLSAEQYVCRRAANQCEQGFKQLHANRESCESKPRCRFFPGHCECTEQGACDCRHSNPPQCSD